jgi:hypothetical protein
VRSVLLYLLLAANAAQASSGLATAMSLNSRIVFGLGYALAPLMLASVLAGTITYYYATPPILDGFLLNLKITWILTLIIAVLLLVMSLDL